MSRGAGSSDSGHERVHDPARADWHGWSAEHPEPPPFGRAVDPTDLAPYASTGGHSAYSYEGRAIQSANLGRALLADGRWPIRLGVWTVLLGFIGVTVGLGLWRLAALL